MLQRFSRWNKDWYAIKQRNRNIWERSTYFGRWGLYLQKKILLFKRYSIKGRQPNDERNIRQYEESRKNRIIQMRWIYLFWCKANVKRFGFNNLHQDLDIMRNIVHTAMDSCRGNWGKENVYNERFINVHSAFLIWKYEVRVWHVEWCWIF